MTTTLGVATVFVDCGAYDGDTARAFLDANGGRFGALALRTLRVLRGRFDYP